MSGIVVAKGTVEIDADVDGVGKAVNKAVDDSSAGVEKSSKGIGTSIFGGIVGGLAAVGAGEAIGSYISGAIGGASDLNETINMSSVIFGKNAAAIESWADTAATKVGMSKSAALDAAASFGDMFLQIGFTGEKATEMSKAVVQASADLGSFKNLDTADVSDRISAAFRGEYDSLQAVIPNINAARVESEALAMTGAKVAKELTAQDKAAAVLAIVQKDGARAMGDFEKTSTGAANSQKILTAQLENQQNKIGTQLLPIWQGFLSFLANSVMPVLTDVVDWLTKNGETLLVVASGLGAAAIAYGVITTATKLYTAYQVAQAAATGGMTIAQWALNAAMSANPIGLIVIAIGALVAGIVWVATQTTFFQDAWAAMTTFIGEAWTWLWETVLLPVFTAIGEIFTWIYNTIIMPIVTGIMIYIGLWAAVIVWLWESVISPVFTAIGAAFTWIYTSVIQPVAGWIGDVIRNVGIVFRALYSAFIKPALDAIAAGFRWVYNTVIRPVANFIGDAISNVGKTIRSVFGGVGEFIGNAFNSALNIVRGPLNGIIGLVNQAIRGLNSLSVKIPDWVPIVGGQTWGLSLPTIPMLARGTNFAPDTFIAGERGPELITGARGATVRPYSATQDLMARSFGSERAGQTVSIEINEAVDPLGSAGRVSAELRKWAP